MITEISYKDHDEWLKIRKNYIGGSDAGAVAGLNPYQSPYAVWAEKTGRIEGFEGNLTTEVGAYLEEFVAQKFAETTGKRVRKKNRTLVNDLYPFAAANVDRMIVGEKALLEIKTSNSFDIAAKVRAGEIVPHWWCQICHYLAVTGLPKAYLAVLINCREFYWFEIERNDVEIEALMGAERDFWDKVISLSPPAVDGSQATTDALKTIYADSDGSRIDLTGLLGQLNNRNELFKQKKLIEDEIARADNSIQQYMGSAEKGEAGVFSVSWKTQERKIFDRKAFEADHGAIADKYFKKSNSRPFKVTMKEE